MDNSADGTTCTATSSAGNSTGQKFTRNSEQPKAPEKRNVLVVDDLYLNRIVLGKLLAGFGFVVTYSSDGQEAVETFQKRKESNEDFYAILMDVNMPTMDGLVATKRIRTIEAASSTAQSSSSREPCGSCSSASSTEAASWLPRRVPIVGVSACSSADQLKSAALDGLQLDPATERPWEVVGMDLFMEKPVNRDKLRAMLDLLDSDAWQRDSSAADSAQQPPPQQQQQQESLVMGFVAGDCCNSLSSFSGGLVDIKVSSRPGGEQVTKRGLGACMRVAAEEHAIKRPRSDCGSGVVEPSAIAPCLVSSIAASAEAAS